MLGFPFIPILMGIFDTFLEHFYIRFFIILDISKYDFYYKETQICLVLSLYEIKYKYNNPINFTAYDQPNFKCTCEIC